MQIDLRTLILTNRRYLHLQTGQFAVGDFCTTGTGKANTMGSSGLDINSLDTLEVLQWSVDHGIGEDTKVTAETYLENDVV
jgi:hypothetical protein